MQCRWTSSAIFYPTILLIKKYFLLPNDLYKNEYSCKKWKNIFFELCRAQIHQQNIFHYTSDDNDDRLLLLLQTELSQNLQQLSERARSTTEFIQRLKGMTDKVHVSINILYDIGWIYSGIRAFAYLPPL